jgi:hypothetical protein
MIKRFSQFIFESKYDSLASVFAKDLFGVIKKTAGSKLGKEISKEFEYDNPLEFTLSIKLARVKEFEPAKSKYFSRLPWEVINFENKGFAIDTNSFIPKENEPESPEIEIILYISPEAEPQCYPELNYKLIDNIRHELEHLLQKGINKKTGHIVNTPKAVRTRAQNNYNYFLLSDEIPAMVAGMYASAKKKRIPLDQEFTEYLQPFIETNVISQSEADKVMKTWIDFAKKVYPVAKFSNKYH